MTDHIPNGPFHAQGILKARKIGGRAGIVMADIRDGLGEAMFEVIG